MLILRLVKAKTGAVKTVFNDAYEVAMKSYNCFIMVGTRCIGPPSTSLSCLLILLKAEKFSPSLISNIF